jgi:hypothetical protein
VKTSEVVLAFLKGRCLLGGHKQRSHPLSLTRYVPE